MASDHIQWADDNLKARNAFFENLNLEKYAKELQGLDMSKSRKYEKKKWEFNPDRKSNRLLKQHMANVSTNRQPVQSVNREPLTNFEDGAHIKRVFKACCSKPEEEAAPKKTCTFKEILNLRVYLVCSGSLLANHNKCLAVHSGDRKVLCAVGDFSGIVSLAFESNEGLLFIQSIAHEYSNSVNGLQFFDNDLYSVGTDGTLRRMTIESFEKGFSILNSSTDFSLNCLAVTTSTDVWVGRSDGHLLHIDTRSHLICDNILASKNPVGHISTSNHLVCTSNKTNDGHVAIWDVRSLKRPLVEAKNTKCTRSAVFLPSSDKFLYWGCNEDNMIRVVGFESGTRFSDHIEPICCEDSENKRFYPAFHPKIPFVFAVSGSDTDLSLYQLEGEQWYHYGFHDKRFTSKHVKLAFHPTLPVLVSTNYASGVAFIRFTEGR